MNRRIVHAVLGFLVPASLSLIVSGCTTPLGLPGDESSPATGSAVIVGKLVGSEASAKLLSAKGEACPDVTVTLNGAPVTIEFDDECAFVISEVQPSDLVELRVELASLGVAGTVELSTVQAGELIEIVVEPTNDSLSISVERRTTPTPSDGLPDVIDANNVSIQLPAGVFEQDLTVLKNNFTLVGVAGASCEDRDGWTVITGKVLVSGNNATFRNVLFEGAVELHGNNARFINCCFGAELMVFGNNTDIDGDTDDDDGSDDDDDHDDGSHGDDDD